MQTVTSSQMKEIERRANDTGLSYTQMMYNAGKSAAEYILGDIEYPCGKTAVVLSGRGNNGGDGYVASKLLKTSGMKVTVLMIDGPPRTADAALYYNSCSECGIEIISFIPETHLPLIESADIIIDALYGTGFHGELNNSARSAARAANGSAGRIYALDLPSGLNADTAEADKDSVRAYATIAFHLPKPAHSSPEAAGFCGKIHCADIGIPYELS